MHLDTMRHFSLTTVLVISLVLVLGVCLSLNFLKNRPLPFDSRRWLAARDEGNMTIPYRMRADLKNKLTQEQPTKDELLKLLGAPDSRIAEAKELPGRRYFKERLFYSLGTHDSLFFNEAWCLDVWVEGGRVGFVGLLESSPPPNYPP